MTKRVNQAGLLVWLTQTSQPIYLVDAKGRIRFFNRGAEAWTGFEAGDVLGKKTSFAAGLTSGVATSREEMIERLLSRLGPPPECFSQGRVATLPWLGEANESSKVLQFLPLADAGEQVETVLCLLVERAEGRDAENDRGERYFWHRQLMTQVRAMRTQSSQPSLVGRCSIWKKVMRQAQMARQAKSPMLVTGPAGTGKSSLVSWIVGDDASAEAMTILKWECAGFTPDVQVNRLQGLLALHEHPDERVGASIIEDVEQLPRDGQVLLAQGYAQGLWVLATSRLSLDEMRVRHLLAPEFELLVSSLVIELPTLTQRGPEDLALLIQSFLASENLKGEKQVSGWNEEFFGEALAYAWPGDVAELKNVIEQAHGHVTEPRLRAVDLPFRFRMGKDAQELREANRIDVSFEPLDLEKHLESVERDLIRQALQTSGGNKSVAAQSLGMTRAKFYRRLEQLGLMGD